jgi:hypothetical protein
MEMACACDSVRRIERKQMSTYLRFTSDAGELLVEVSSREVESGPGEQNAGLRRWARDQMGDVVAVARRGFEEAVRQAIHTNVPAFLAAAEALEKPPAEMQITFGLKGTGEVGNLAVGKVAGECNYQVTMVWKRDPS